MTHPPGDAPLTARRLRKQEFAGIGCVLEAIGLLLLFLFPIGTVIGVVLLVYGSQKASFWVCDNCHNRLTDKEVRICPVCKATLT